MGRRKYKGEISLHNDRGKIRLRWRLNSKRYSLNLSWTYTRTHIITAKKIVQHIEHDDKAGLNRSKAAIVESTKRNICGKVTRELIKGSIEVYPINGYGAVEMGLHVFHNNQEPPPKHPNVGRFVIIWEQTTNGWKISRVISLH